MTLQSTHDDGIRLTCRVEASVRRRTTIAQEFVWLAIFFAIFAAIAGLALGYAGSHRFNDRIAIMLSGLISGLVTIALRARFLGPHARRP